MVELGMSSCLIHSCQESNQVRGFPKGSGRSANNAASLTHTFIMGNIFSLFKDGMDKGIYLFFYVQRLVELTDDPKNSFKSCIIREFNMVFLFDTYGHAVWWKIYNKYFQRILQCPTCIFEGFY